MKLTAYSNYSMRILMVAAARGDRLTTVQDVADAFGISKAHLVKCTHQLGAWGYLTTVRGHKGGFRLARPAHEITVGEVIRRTEDGFDLVECFAAATNTCPLIGLCRLSCALKAATAAFLAVLDGTTLADVTADKRTILALLDARTPVAAE